MKIQEPLCGAYSQWRSAYKRGSTSKRSRSKSIRDSGNYSKKRLLFYRLENSAKTTDIPKSGSAVKKHILWKKWQEKRYNTEDYVPTVGPGLSRREDNYVQNAQLRLFWVSRVIHHFLGVVRRQHRHRRICLQQVQLKSEVTD